MGFDSAYTSKSAHPRPNTLSVGMVAFIAIAGLQPFAVACTPSWEALLLGICLAIALPPSDLCSNVRKERLPLALILFKIAAPPPYSSAPALLYFSPWHGHGSPCSVVCNLLCSVFCFPARTSAPPGQGLNLCGSQCLHIVGVQMSE